MVAQSHLRLQGYCTSLRRTYSPDPPPPARPPGILDIDGPTIRFPSPYPRFARRSSKPSKIYQGVLRDGKGGGGSRGFEKRAACKINNTSAIVTNGCYSSLFVILDSRHCSTEIWGLYCVARGACSGCDVSPGSGVPEWLSVGVNR